MKKSLFTIVFLQLFIIGFSQGIKRSSYFDQTFLISIGANAALPVGANASSISYMLGGDLQGEYKPVEHLGITLNFSYSSFVKKNTTTNGIENYKGTVAFIKTQGGVKYTFSNDIFLHGQLGIALSQSGGGNKICYQPGVGYDFSRNFDLELGLAGIKGAGDLGGSLNTINMRIGYNF